MQAITGNDLITGRVVYMDADGGWTAHFGQARVDSDEALIERMLACAREAAARGEVVEPYAIDILDGDGTPRPARIRETIRSQGPTVPSDFSQAA